jgi:Cu/Ag efflux protein CusF
VKNVPILGFLLLAAILAGCNTKPAGSSEEVEGFVLRVDTAHKMLTLDHEEIPGFIQALTMSYPVDSTRFLTAVRVEDTVMFTLRHLGPGEFSISTLRNLRVPKKPKGKK